MVAAQLFQLFGYGYLILQRKIFLSVLQYPYAPLEGRGYALDQILVWA